VVDEKDFQKRVQKIGELVHAMESQTDPSARAQATELVQCLMDLHGAALERILEIVFQSGEGGAQIIDDLGRDPLTSSILILYGIHPDDLPTRVQRRLEQVRSRLFKTGAEATLIGAEDGNVRVQVRVDAHACGSTAKTARGIVEEALYEAAPDMKSLVIEGLEEPAASGFIAVEQLMRPQNISTLSAIGQRDSARISSDGMD
jgi:hypothetical protein